MNIWLQDKQLKVLEKNLQMKNNAVEVLTAALEENRDADSHLKPDDQDLVDPEEDKIVIKDLNHKSWIIAPICMFHV